MKGQSGLYVTAVDQISRDPYDVSSHCSTRGVDWICVEPKRDNDGGNVSDSQPVPLRFVDRNVGKHYDYSVKVAQDDDGGSGRGEEDDCKSADFGIRVDLFGGIMDCLIAGIVSTLSLASICENMM